MGCSIYHTHRRSYLLWDREFIPPGAPVDQSSVVFIAEQNSPVWLDPGLFNHVLLKEDILVVSSVGPLQIKLLRTLLCRFICEQHAYGFKD